MNAEPLVHIGRSFKSILKPIILLSFILLLFGEGAIPSRLEAQTKNEVDENEILARIGPRTITVRDFLERIDLMPWEGKENPETRDSAKVRALASLVAEKLMSMKAADEGFAQTPRTSSSLMALERLMARDELYHEEVINKILTQPEDVARGLYRYASTLTLNTFVLDSKENAEALSNFFNTQSDSVRYAMPSRGITSHDTISISFSDMVPSYEDVAYEIDSVGKARSAYAPEFGWAVFQLLGKSTNPNFGKENMSERQATVQQKLKKRKEQAFATMFLRKFFTRPIEIDSVMFRLVADTLLSIMRTDSAGHRQEGYFGVRGDDVENMRIALGLHLANRFVTMGDYTVSTEQIIHELKFFPIRFQSLRRNSFQRTFSQSIHPLSEAALLSQEALRRRMNERLSVRHDMNVWVDAMQADKLLKYLLDSLGHAYEGVQLGSGDTLSGVEMKAVETINRYLSSLANTYKVEMDFSKLKRVEISPSNIVTRRFIGFGGAMMATPMLLRLWDWLSTWKVSQQIPP